MKHPMSRRKAKPVFETLPLMASVAAVGEQDRTAIEVTGAIERKLNVAKINYNGREGARIHLGTMALRACLRLAGETSLRRGTRIVRALDLQREGVLPWGTACGTMTEVFESIATGLDGNAARDLLRLWWGSESGEPPWSYKDWSDHLNMRFDLNIDFDDRFDLCAATIRQLLGRTRPPRGNKSFLRAKGWRPDFAYLHGETSISKDGSPDGIDLAYSLGYRTG